VAGGHVAGEILDKGSQAALFAGDIGISFVGSAGRSVVGKVAVQSVAEGELKAAARSGTSAAIKAGAEDIAKVALEESAKRVAIVEKLTEVLSQSNLALKTAIRAKDVAALRGMGLSSKQISILLKGGKGPYAAIYGQAIEKLVRLGIEADPLLRSSLEYIGNKAGYVARLPGMRGGRPDFIGKGLIKGLLVDITTEAGAAKHYAREYGEKMLVLTYKR
jgi:hypothetical protein